MVFKVPYPSEMEPTLKIAPVPDIVALLFRVSVPVTVTVTPGLTVKVLPDIVRLALVQLDDTVPLVGHCAYPATENAKINVRRQKRQRDIIVNFSSRKGR